MVAVLVFLAMICIHTILLSLADTGYENISERVKSRSLHTRVQAPSIFRYSQWNKTLSIISHGFPRFRDLCVDLLNHLLQHRFAFLQRVRVDVPGMFLAIGPDR